jgi:hypothetical protein
MPTDDPFMQTLARGLHTQATAQAGVGADLIHIPMQELPPALSELEREFFKERYDKDPPPAPQPPDSISRNEQINFPDWYAAAGGWTSLTLHSNGDWNFSGHMHDSGFVSYGDSVVWAVKNLGSDEIYVFPHGGHMDGTAATIWGGSRNDDWNNTGTNQVLADSWEGFFKPGGGFHLTMQARVNTDLKAVIDDAEKILGLAAAVIAFL